MSPGVPVAEGGEAGVVTGLVDGGGLPAEELHLVHGDPGGDHQVLGAHVREPLRGEPHTLAGEVLEGVRQRTFFLLAQIGGVRLSFTLRPVLKSLRGDRELPGRGRDVPPVGGQGGEGGRPLLVGVPPRLRFATHDARIADTPSARTNPPPPRPPGKEWSGEEDSGHAQ